ncbi:MAG: XTP/dITP diphosphatase [Candidatus Bathyarchaeota archaeon]|nr:XTP/dITP diphosphatase [Candidatus Bathyarchaeota archaeon]
MTLFKTILKKNRIWLGTANMHKVREAAEILAPYGIKLEHYPLERIEIQADDLADIAAFSLKTVPVEIPIAIEDAGIFISHYDGFPGPYSSYVLGRLNNSGILKLMEGITDRSVQYLSAVAYRDENGVRIFRGTVEGIIADRIRGRNGFGYDPIFIPNEGDGRTFGEMSDTEKNKISHRARAFQALAEWFTQ